MDFLKIFYFFLLKLILFIKFFITYLNTNDVLILCKVVNFILNIVPNIFDKYFSLRVVEEKQWKEALLAVEFLL